jgi:hypothetical protein
MLMECNFQWREMERKKFENMRNGEMSDSELAQFVAVGA